MSKNMRRTAFGSLALVAFVTAFVLTASVSAFDLDSLLVKSVGGEQAKDRMESVRTFYLKGNVSLNGMPGKMELAYLYPDRLLFRMDLGGFSLAQGVDGVTAWQQDHNGAVSELSGYEKRELRNQLFFYSCSYLFDDRESGGKEYLGLEDRDGVTCHKVAFYPFNQDTVYAYFDTATADMIQMVSQLDNLTSITTSDDFRTVEGIRQAFHSKMKTLEAPISMESFVTYCRYDTTLAVSMFERPDNTVRDYGFPSEKDVVSVPFNYINGHIYVPVTINGKRKVRLILDSGASANIFNEKALDGLNLEPIGKLPAKGVAGYEEADLYKTDSLQIGDLTLYSQVGGAMDLSMIGDSVMNEPFGGVLGYDFLSRFPMSLDFKNQTLVVYNPDRFVPKPGGTIIPFRLTMNIPTVRAELDSVSGDFIVDLGNAFGVIVHEEFYKRHNLQDRLKNIQEAPGSLGGVGGGVKNLSAVADRFAVGEIEIPDMWLMIARTGQGLTGSAELAGNIGSQFWRQYEVLLDYPRSRLIVYPPDQEGN